MPLSPGRGRMQAGLMTHAFVLVAAVTVFFVQGPRFVFHLWDRLFDNGDSFINSWILAWNAHALFKPGVSVWDAPIFYPVRGALACSEAMFGNLWITLPVQYLTGNPTFAANMLILASFVLAVYAVFLLVSELTGNFWSGLIAGLVFSFNPYRWGHALHLQLLPSFWAPLALLFANRFMRKPQRRYLLGIAGMTVTQYYASIYLGTMLVVLLLILFAIHLLLERQGSERWTYVTDSGLRTTTILSCLAAGILLLPLAIGYVKVANTWHFYRGLEESSLYSAEPLGFLLRPLYAASYVRLYNVLPGKIRESEGAVFLGITPWLLAGFTLLVARRPRFGVNAEERVIIRRYAWASLIVAILMLGPYLIFFDHNTHIPLPYQLVYYLLPGAKAMRVPARFVQVLLLCLAVIGGYGVAGVLKSMAGWRRTRKTVAILVFAFFFWWDYAVCPNDGVLAEPKDRFPPVYEYLAKSSADRPVLELPVEDAKYLHYQTGHWRPLLGGHSGWLPSPRIELTVRTGDDPLGPSVHTGKCPSEECLNFIRYTPAATLVVHLDKYADAQRAAWERADLSQFGFNFAGKFGSALVWERGTENEQFSNKLAVSKEDLVLDDARGRIGIVLRPSEKGKAWRYFSRASTKIKVMITTQDGKKVGFRNSITVPSYLLPDDRFPCSFSSKGISLSKIRTIRLGGSIIEECTVDFDLQSSVAGS
jgi:hypothetical protein